MKQGLDKNFKEDLTVNLPRQTLMFRVLRGADRNFRETFDSQLDSHNGTSIQLPAGGGDRPLNATFPGREFIQANCAELNIYTIDELVNKLNEILEHAASSSCHVRACN